jgi:hypothetical protein
MSDIKQIDAESIDKTFSDSIGVSPSNVNESRCKYLTL